VNTTIILISGLLWFFLIYRFYVRIIDKKVIVPDDRHPTPAHTQNDGIDYVPSPKPLLFGHHFSSIAGAGPIVGPILAYALFGWGPALLWILLGTAFIGIIHDYLSLMVSVRNKGISITEISGRVISPTAKWMFSIFVWLSLILIVAVFSIITAQTLAEKPEIVIPTLGLIGLAIFFGLAVYRWKMKLIPATIVSWVIIVFLVDLGYQYPISASFEIWFYVFLLYSYIASSIPVWILLQPRDYLSMTILFVGLIIGYAGILILHPTINGPVYVSFVSKNTPLVPMLFVIIACGAISGFHSLVASGTTAKQLDKESSAKFIGAGGMIFEGVLALLVLFLVASALFWNKAPETLSRFIFQDLMKRGPIITFGNGFGRAVSVLGIPLNIGIALGILMLNAFVLTSLDTAVRLSRFVFQEALFKKKSLVSNRWIAGFIGILLAFTLAKTNSWNIIWPIFGSANQLIAALALFTVTAYLAGIKKPTRFSFIPSIFMWLVTESSLLYLIIFQYARGFLKNTGDSVLTVTAAILLVLGAIVGTESLKSIKSGKGKLRT
jgi:carbon starvation protein